MEFTFDKAWIDQYWAGIEPEIVQCLSIYEQRESWTIKDDSHHYAELNQIAKNLPVIAQLPLDHHAMDTANNLIIIMAAIPIKTALAAYSWLNELSGEESDMPWSYVISFYAKKIMTNRDLMKDSHMYDSAKIMTRRIDLYCNLLDFNTLFLTDSSVKSAMNLIREKLE